MNKTSISWVLNPDGSPGFTWNPVLGCKAVSPGCANCYAARLASTRLAHLPAYAGLAHDGKWTGEQRFLPERLAEPLRKRKPCGVFVADMSDLYGEGVTNEQIAAVYGVMAACPQHRFYVCTKRAKRRREWFEWLNSSARTCNTLRGMPPQAFVVAVAQVHFGLRAVEIDDVLSRPWPLPNVIELTSVEDQKTADERLADALATPAAVRGLSVEPLLEEVRIDDIDNRQGGALKPLVGLNWVQTSRGLELSPKAKGPKLDWVIVGGESGSHARPCHVEWIRSIVYQCEKAGVPVFVKQLGARYEDALNGIGGALSVCPDTVPSIRKLRDRAGADPAEWSADLRVRQMPVVKP